MAASASARLRVAALYAETDGFLELDATENILSWAAAAVEGANPSSSSSSGCSFRVLPGTRILVAKAAAKHIIKLHLPDSNSHVFVFHDRPALDLVKDFVTNILASCRNGDPSTASASEATAASTCDAVTYLPPDIEMRVRADLLRLHRPLVRLHRELVASGLVTESEFWASRKHLLLAAADNAMQLRGLPSSSSATFLPDQCNTHTLNKDGRTSVQKYTLTPQTINSIFASNPAVLQLYRTNVPDSISEKDFWIRYFQSLATKSTGACDPLFGSLFCDASKPNNPNSPPTAERLANIAPLLNVAATVADRITDPATIQDFTSRCSDSVLPLIRRINRHSENVLRTVLGNDLLQKSVPTPAKEIVLEDLVGAREPRYMALHLDTAALPSASTISIATKSNYADLDPISATDRLAISRKRRTSVESFSLCPDLASCNADDSNRVQCNLTSLVRSQGEHPHPRMLQDLYLPTELGDELISTKANLMELLRHYYSSLAGGDIDRQKRMTEALRQRRDKLGRLRLDFEQKAVELGNDVMDSVDSHVQRADVLIAASVAGQLERLAAKAINTLLH